MKDFDVLAPPRRTAKLGGEVIDVSVMSARVALKFIGFSDKYNFGKSLTLQTKQDEFKPEMLEDMVEIIALICRKDNPKITADWLLDNIELPVLIQFMQYVFEPMTSRMKSLNVGDGGKGGEGEPEKN